MSSMRLVLLVLGLFLLPLSVYAEKYTIDGEFDGCEHGKLYPLVGGGILECLEYTYFYEYMPDVIADGREVIVIGNERVEGRIHDGSVIETRINGEFDGCDFDKKYSLVNGLIFVCSTYSYTYSFMPEVKIILISSRSPVVYIGGEEYDGALYKP